MRQATHTTYATLNSNVAPQDNTASVVDSTNMAKPSLPIRIGSGGGWYARALMAADFETGACRDASPVAAVAAARHATFAHDRRSGLPDEIQAALDDTAEHYRACGRLAHGYVRCKLRHDPVHRDVLALASREHFGHVVDVGCGRGQLGTALLQAGLADSVTGIDCHAGHLAEADRAAAGLAFATRLQDLAHGVGSLIADTILAVDVLYQLDDASQQRLLQAVTRAARQRIVLRLLDPERGMRSALTLGLERLWQGFSPHAGAWVNPWPLARLASIVEPAGYDITVKPCWRGTPFANILFIARRRR